MIILRLPNTLEKLEKEKESIERLNAHNPGSWSAEYRWGLYERYLGRESCKQKIAHAADKRAQIFTDSPFGKDALTTGFMYRLAEIQEREQEYLLKAVQKSLQRAVDTDSPLIDLQDTVEALYLQGKFAECLEQFERAKTSYRGHIDKLLIHYVAELARASVESDPAITESVIVTLKAWCSLPKRNIPYYIETGNITTLHWLEEACKLHSKQTKQLHPFLVEV